MSGNVDGDEGREGFDEVVIAGRLDVVGGSVVVDDDGFGDGLVWDRQKGVTLKEENLVQQLCFNSKLGRQKLTINSPKQDR